MIDWPLSAVVYTKLERRALNDAQVANYGTMIPDSLGLDALGSRTFTSLTRDRTTEL